MFRSVHFPDVNITHSSFLAFLSHWNVSVLLSKVNWPSLGLFLDSIVSLIYLSVLKTTVLIIAVLKSILKSNSVKSSNFASPPPKYLVILDILHFHVSLRIKIYLPLFFPVTQRHNKPILEKNIYLFSIALRLPCGTWAFDRCTQAFSSFGARASHCSDFSCCRAQALELRLSSCRVWAYLSHGMWDPPRPGDRSCDPCIGRQSLNHWIIREVHKPTLNSMFCSKTLWPHT